jgi:hypothetical protein
MSTVHSVSFAFVVDDPENWSEEAQGEAESDDTTNTYAEWAVRKVTEALDATFSDLLEDNPGIYLKGESK